MARPPLDQRLKSTLELCNEALEHEDFEALIGHTVAAFELAENGNELWRVAGVEPIWEGTYGNGIFPAEVVNAIAEKARVWKKSSDVRSALALVARIASQDPGQLVLLEEMPELTRVTTRKAISALRQQLHDWLGAESADVRSAAMLALAASHNPRPADAQAVLERLASERDEEALATAAVAFGAIARGLSKTTLKKLIGKARAAWDVCREHDSPLVRACAAAGSALVEGSLDARNTEALCEVVSEPRPLPDSWAWRWSDGVDDSGHFGVRVLSWARTPPEARSTVVAALVRHAKRKDRDPRWEDALCRNAFGEMSKQPSDGVLPTQLDDDQRAALAAMAKHKPRGQPSSPWIRALGFAVYEDLGPFLEERGGVGRSIATGSGTQPMSFVQIWKAYLAKKMSQQQSVSAIVGGQTMPEATAALTSLQRSSLVGLTAPLEKRDMELMVATMRALAAKGDLVSAVRKCISTGDCDEQPAAIGLLAGYEARDEAPPAGDHALIAEGLAYRPKKTSLEGLLQRLSKKQQKAIDDLFKKVRASG